MVVIETGKELILENMLSLRKKMMQEEINQEMMKIGKFFEVNGIKKNGSVVTTTYAIEANNVLDMEILVPMDKVMDLPYEYRLKPVFKLLNAVYARHKGNPALLQGVYNEIMAYIQQNGLQQITTAYNVAVKDMLPGMSVDDFEIDVYIGVSSNVL